MTQEHARRPPPQHHSTPLHYTLYKSEPRRKLPAAASRSSTNVPRCSRWSRCSILRSHLQHRRLPRARRSGRQSLVLRDRLALQRASETMLPTGCLSGSVHMRVLRGREGGASVHTSEEKLASMSMGGGRVLRSPGALIQHLQRFPPPASAAATRFHA
jgi:hypothetical protein